MGKSSRLTIVLAGARVFCLGLLALLLTLPCDSGVGAVNFTFSGFKKNSRIKMTKGKYWKLDTTTGCFQFKPPDAQISGQFLYPEAVAVLDPGSGAVKSFSTTFIYGLHKFASEVPYTGPDMKFIMVDKDSGGTPQVFMELHGTKESPPSLNDHASDNHTFGAEFDTFMNQEFNDHIRYQQTWIDYSEATSRGDKYYANYKQGKPATPRESTPGPDVSHMKKNMFIGFSTGEGIDSSNVPYICAWSFTNDGSQAQSIVIAQDDSAAAPPPPPGPRPPATPPISPPRISSLPSPSPISPSPNGSPPPPSKPLTAPSPGPGHAPPPVNVPAAVGGSLAVLVVSICLFSLCWNTVLWRRPLRIFISHARGPNGAGKNFPSWLHQAMTSRRRWSRSKFHVEPFLDVENCPKGLPYAGKILKELERFDVAVVVVTPDFFERHWPMTELIKFVEVQKKDREGRIRVLPLFYDLTPDELKQGLDQGTWENFWVEPSEDNHPLQLQECRDAVTWLCNQTGIRYVSHDRDQDKDYIDRILKEVDKILCDERSIAADLRWAMKKLNITRSGPTPTKIE